MKAITSSLAALLTLSALPLSAHAQPVRPLGRVDAIDASSFNIEWPMSGFEARFDGTKLSAVIEDTGKNWLNVEVDGKVRAVPLKEGRHTYKLFSGLEGQHLVRVTRRTGAQEGPTTFASVTAENLRPTQAPDRQVLVIGDSIASGYGIEGDNQWCHFTQETQNAGLAWPALLSRAFGADMQLLSVDGRGLYRNYDGDAPTMATLMERIVPSEEALWAGRYMADAVIVNLGTNDFAAGAPGPRFKDAYVATLGRLRAAYPRATIIATIGGMLERPKLIAAKAAIESAVAVRQAAGDTRTSFVFLDPPSTGRRFGCDWHPGKDAQANMAQTLQAALTKALGWKSSAAK